MKKILFVILVLSFTVMLSSQDSPTKQDVEQCLLKNMKECLEANIISVEIQEIDSSIAKAQFNNNVENESSIIYLKLEEVKNVWNITEVSTDRNTWMDASVLYEEANKFCRREIEKIERKKVKEKSRKENPQEATLTDFKSMCMAILDYSMEHGDVPNVTSIEELAKILSPMYLQSCPTQDAWDEKIIYKKLGEGQFVLISKGADRKADTGDDISIDQDGNIKKKDNN